MKKTAGIHHITAVVGHPQENADFYANVLGLRLVKKTVNFDEPGTYHLYFGNDGGEPGTIITFFPVQGARQGKIGGGQVGTTSYAVPIGALPFWKNRLKTFNIPCQQFKRFGEARLSFADPHGLQLEIVEREINQENRWTIGKITPQVAIKGFAGATLLSTQPEQTAQLLKNGLGFKKVGVEGSYIRFQSYGEIGNMIEVNTSPIARGRMGIGTHHHIAWRADDDDDDQLDWKKHLEGLGYRVTPVQDRNYFNSIYFRERGEILFEIATDPPGFTHDESYETMGKNLMLPKQYEKYREQLRRSLPPIELGNIDQ